MRACGCKDSENFFPLTPSPNTKVTQAIFLTIPSARRVSHSPSYWGCGGVWTPSLCKVFLRFHVWCPQLFLLTPSHQQQSGRVLMVTKTQALGGELLWCFLASQGPLPTLILDLCSSPLSPCYYPLYGAASHEERRKDRKPPPGHPHQLNMGD